MKTITIDTPVIWDGETVDATLTFAVNENGNIITGNNTEIPEDLFRRAIEAKLFSITIPTKE